MKRKVTAEVERISGGFEAAFRIVVIHDNGNREMTSANTVFANDLADLLLNGVVPQARVLVPDGLKRVTITFDTDDSW